MSNSNRVSVILFLCLFAAQAGLIALSPVLVEVASDFDVSTAAAGQLRTISGLAAGLTALGLGAVAKPLQLRRLLMGGSVLLAAGSLASAAAPNFAVLALVQLAIGAAVASLVTAGTAAAAEWAPPEERARVLSLALVGSPAAWIIGMPLAGLVGGASWRYAWLGLPLVAAIVAACAAAAAPRPAATSAAHGGLLAALSDRDISRWALSELLANSAWIGLLVYSGALFTQSYSTSTTRTGVILALAAVAFAAGNLTSRRHAEGHLRQRLVALALTMAVVVALFGIARPSPAVSAGLFIVAAFLGGARTLLGNAFGLQAAPERRVAVMAARAAANQFGYFVGSAVGGLALAASGYAGFGVVLGLLFGAAAAALSTRPAHLAWRGARPTL